MPRIDNSATGGTISGFSDSHQGNPLVAQTFTVPNDPAYGALTALTFYYDHLSGGTLDFTVMIAEATEAPSGGFAVGNRIFDTRTYFLTPDNDDQLAAMTIDLGNLALVAGRQYVFILNAGLRHADGGRYLLGSNASYAGGMTYEKGGNPYNGDWSAPNVFQDMRFILDFAAANSLPVANDDVNDVAEGAETSGSVFAGSDSDAEGDPFTVTHVNGSSARVGELFTLPSGAQLLLTPQGTYSYLTMNAFDHLVSPSTGAANSTATDTFTYTVTGGDTATVTITIYGENDAGNRLLGSAGDDTITGTSNNDVFDLRQGGNDKASGLGGVDSFYFGGAFTALDTVDGGDNRDSLLLQGNYAGGVTLGDATRSSIVGVESISLFSGSNIAFGDPGTNLYSYTLTLLDSNVAAGALMKVNGYHLLAGENLTLDASDEKDAPLQIFAGLGIDRLTGGQMGDAFVFGEDGRFGAGDTVAGGGGYDVLYLRGDYAIDFNAAGYAGSLSGVESIALLTSANTEFLAGGDGDFDYTIVWNDAMLGAGGTMTVNGGRLQSHETFTFNGASEQSGNLRVFGGEGADALTTGGGNDQIYGGGGADTITGGGGADLYRYYATTDSGPTAPDLIHGFAPGQDRIDLQRIDARTATSEDDAFAYVGANAFTAAGQLRAVHVSGTHWRIEGEVNGDNVADFILDVLVDGAQPLTAADFFL